MASANTELSFSAVRVSHVSKSNGGVLHFESWSDYVKRTGQAQTNTATPTSTGSHTAPNDHAPSQQQQYPPATPSDDDDDDSNDDDLAYENLMDLFSRYGEDESEVDWPAVSHHMLARGTPRSVQECKQLLGQPDE